MQDLSVLQVPVVVVAAVLVLTVLARRLRVAAPMLWLLGGVALAFVPWTSSVTLPPDVVLLLFLPVLLFWESLSTSLREIRANLRVVVLHSVPLVLVTAAAVAAVAHLLGLSWPVAWVLGAVGRSSGWPSPGWRCGRDSAATTRSSSPGSRCSPPSSPTSRPSSSTPPGCWPSWCAAWR